MLEQWELKRGSKVKLKSGKIYTFLGMDGAYAKWEDEKGEFCVGNFDKFAKTKEGYRVL